MTDPKKIAEIHARTRPDARTRDAAAVPEQEWDHRLLALGSHVGEFEITGVIGQGGFGIVYLAWDHSLERAVALKEYMPASLASRRNQTQVSPLSERYRETFQVGLGSFVNEARLLAQFHSPSLVEVHRFWEGNGTAYMAMPYYRGVTLGETVRSLQGPPSEAWLMDLLAPLTDALMELHSVQCYHRDIAPDNILILADSGSPLLLDFGAARRVIADQAHAPTIILKTGYAPIEQYGTVPGMRQGPWTDVYALASVVYWAVTGKTPPPATTRMMRDAYVPLAECAASQYSRRFATAIDRALAVLPDDRTDSITTLRGELGLDPVTMRGASPPLGWVDPDATVLAASRTGPKEQAQSLKVEESRAEPDPTGSARLPTGPAVTRARPGRVPMAAGAAAVVLAIGGAAGLWMSHSDRGGRPASSAVSRRSDIRPPPTPAPPPSLPEALPAAPADIPLPHSAADALALILAKRDPALQVSVEVSEPRLRRGVDVRSLRYTASEPGYLYLAAAASGNDEALELLLPAPGSVPTRVQTSGKLELPIAGLTPGAWKFAFVVARRPLDLAANGWLADRGVWTRRFSGETSPRAQARLPWDMPACTPGLANCASTYGAAAFELGISPARAMDVAKQPPAKSTDPVRKAERAGSTPRMGAERTSSKSAKAATNPECEKIFMRVSLGESSPELIERMKVLKCN